jgi:hypothetical protein
MSFVKAPLKDSGSHFLLEVVPNPAVNVTDEQKVVQTEAIKKLQNTGRDLFANNPAVDVNGQMKSRQLYNRRLRVKHLVDIMHKNDLVLRAHLKGEQSACVQFLPSQVKDGVSESPTGSFSLVHRGNYIASVDYTKA